MYQRPVLNLKRSREYTPDATRSFSYMKLFLIITALLLPTILNAQGRIGNKPRTDIVMLSQSVRDSLSDEVFAHILDLRHYAETDQVDSAAPWIAFNGLPDFLSSCAIAGSNPTLAMSAPASAVDPSFLNTLRRVAASLISSSNMVRSSSRPVKWSADHSFCGSQTQYRMRSSAILSGARRKHTNFAPPVHRHAAA